jgi:hypothetical protein
VRKCLLKAECLSICNPNIAEENNEQTCHVSLPSCRFGQLGCELSDTSALDCMHKKMANL